MRAFDAESLSIQREIEEGRTEERVILKDRNQQRVVLEDLV